MAKKGFMANILETDKTCQDGMDGQKFRTLREFDFRCQLVADRSDGRPFGA
ncbi:MAG: hypothetical protein JSS86_05890 [Cyanobacteria bacterium SZAS LIN-2]|nr:hypothetical protein [Cyanobacteria bacterium SZAS LIN-2]